MSKSFEKSLGISQSFRDWRVKTYERCLLVGSVFIIYKLWCLNVYVVNTTWKRTHYAVKFRYFSWIIITKICAGNLPVKQRVLLIQIFTKRILDKDVEKIAGLSAFGNDESHFVFVWWVANVCGYNSSLRLPPYVSHFFLHYSHFSHPRILKCHTPILSS